MLLSRDSEYNFREKGNLFEEVIIVIILTAIASVIRFWNLGAWSFWADEIFSMQDAQQFPDVITVNPLVYMLIHNITNIFGISEWSARLGPCIIGVLSIPFIYLFARKMFDSQVGIIASLFLTIHPWHIFWSQNARAYTMAFLIAGIAAIFFYQALERNKISYMIVSLLLTLLAISSYLQCVLLLPIFLGYVILLLFLPINIPKGLNGKNLFVFFAPFFLALFSLFLPSVRGYVSSGWGSNEWGRNYLYILFTVVYSLGIPFSAASLVGGIHSLAYMSRGGLFLICYTIIPLFLLMIISPFLNVAGYYLFFTMPAYVVLAALCASEVARYTSRSKILSFAIPLILAISLISQVYLYFTIENGGREKWKEAFESIKGIIKPEDAVVVSIPRIAEYYLGKSDTIQLENVIPDINTFKGKGKDIWFVLDEPSVGTLDPGAQFREWLYSNCKLFKEFPVYARVMDRTISVWRLEKTVKVEIKKQTEKPALMQKKVIPEQPDNPDAPDWSSIDQSSGNNKEDR